MCVCVCVAHAIVCARPQATIVTTATIRRPPPSASRRSARGWRLWRRRTKRGELDPAVLLGQAASARGGGSRGGGGSGDSGDGDASGGEASSGGEAGGVPSSAVDFDADEQQEREQFEAKGGSDGGGAADSPRAHAVPGGAAKPPPVRTGSAAAGREGAKDKEGKRRSRHSASSPASSAPSPAPSAAPSAEGADGTDGVMASTPRDRKRKTASMTASGSTPLISPPPKSTRLEGFGRAATITSGEELSAEELKAATTPSESGRRRGGSWRRGGGDGAADVSAAGGGGPSEAAEPASKVSGRCSASLSSQGLGVGVAGSVSVPNAWPRLSVDLPARNSSEELSSVDGGALSAEVH